jgi:hypothetical protein
MTIECWTVIHRVTEPIRHAAPIRHLLHHIARALPRPHPAHVIHAAVSHPRTWIETVCRVLPAAAVTGGVLIPRMAGPPPAQLLQPPPAIVAPAPAPSIGFAPPLILFPSPLILSAPPIITAPPVRPPADVPQPAKGEVAEPSSLALLLGGLGGLAALSAIRRWGLRRHRGGRSGRNSARDSGIPTAPG